jgi:hypothetical protein
MMLHTSMNLIMEDVADRSVIIKDRLSKYSKYYASIAIDQFKIFFNLNEPLIPHIIRVVLVKYGKKEITKIPAEINLFVDDMIRYKKTDIDLRTIVSKIVDIDNDNDNTGIPWSVYAKYTIRDNYYMICFYNLQYRIMQPNSILYEGLMSAWIIDKHELCIYDVTDLFKMYEGPNFDFNTDIVDITVLDILLTPKKFYDINVNLELFVNYSLRLEYFNRFNVLSFDDRMSDNLKVAENIISL